VNELTTTIQNAAWNATTNKHYKPNQTKIVPHFIRELITAKRKARKKWQATRLPSHKKLLNQLTNRLTHTLRTYKQELYNIEISTLSATNNSLWTKTKQILKYKGQKYPILTSSGEWAKSDEEKSLLFSSYLTDLFSNHCNNTDPHENLIDDCLSQPLQLTMPPKAISPSDVTYTIHGLKKRKTPGYDLITAETLSHLPKKQSYY